VIFGGVTVAWMVLGTTMWVRTEKLDSRLSDEMASLIGPSVVAQPAPYWAAKASAGRGGDGAVTPSASTIKADIVHDDRYKGLLWYSTFKVSFSSVYTVPAGSGGVAAPGFFIFDLPKRINGHDGLTVTVDGAEVAVGQKQKQSGHPVIPVDRQQERTVSVSFSTFGQDVWLYMPVDADKALGRWDRYGGSVVTAPAHMTELNNFSLTITTSFRNIDYPKGTVSPTTPAVASGQGMTATWKRDRMVTNQAMGMAMPHRINAGPIATRMSYFAPVSLFFFFTVLFTVVVLKKIPLHPMHYLFISAAFFAFHILLAYLADQMDIHLAFWICAAVSTVLVVSYMRLVVGVKFAVSYVAAAQLVYLVGFSYAFFWEGKTGLTVTIGAIATLFVLMMATGKVDWSAVFKRPGKIQLPTITPAGSAAAPPVPSDK